MTVPGETEAGNAGMHPCRGIAWWAHRDDDQSAEALPRSSKNQIGSVDPDALKIPARRAEFTLTENARVPFHAEPGQSISQRIWSTTLQRQRRAKRSRTSSRCSVIPDRRNYPRTRSTWSASSIRITTSSTPRTCWRKSTKPFGPTVRSAGRRPRQRRRRDRNSERHGGRSLQRCRERPPWRSEFRSRRLLCRGLLPAERTVGPKGLVDLRQHVRGVLEVVIRIDDADHVDRVRG